MFFRFPMMGRCVTTSDAVRPGGSTDYQRDMHQILGEFAQAEWNTLDEEPRQGANDRRL
jgi:hypothetical protein